MAVLILAVAGVFIVRKQRASNKHGTYYVSFSASPVGSPALNVLHITPSSFPDRINGGLTSTNLTKTTPDAVLSDDDTLVIRGEWEKTGDGRYVLTDDRNDAAGTCELSLTPSNEEKTYTLQIGQNGQCPRLNGLKTTKFGILAPPDGWP